ncbi:MAG: cadherin domain-containing protein, partial [bacterium]|nr:cadherin domain-containing protein [bacterium]
DDVAVTEGNSGTTTASFTVSLSAASGKTITVDYATSDNTATTADGDYDQETTTTLTFNPGETSKSVDITVNGDTKDEANETFYVDLSNPTNSTISDNQGVGTINNDDTAPTISIDDVAVTEGNSGTTTASFTVSLDAASGKTISVEYETNDNLATTSDGDYDAIGITLLTFNPGEISKTVDVTVNGDTKDEVDESFHVDLINPTNSTISDGRGVGLINDDDAAPLLSINDIVVTEGNTGTTTATFTVSLNIASGKTITFDYVTVDNSATVADGDYNQITTTPLTLNPGETSLTIDVLVNGDTDAESDELFLVTLSNLNNASINDNQGECIILDDDTVPAITIGDAIVNEGNTGTVTASFNVSLDFAIGSAVTVDYSTSDNTATDTDGDYDAIATTTLTFNPGETSKTVSVTVNGDSKDESDESFFVDLSNPTNATITDNQGEGTITNDDTAPGISIDDVTVTEGNSGTITADFTVSLGAVSGKTITVDYSTSDNTATDVDGDYDAIATTTLTFNPGETSKTVSVTVNGDSKDESDESFFIDLSNPTNATITDNQGEGTITNDDTAPGISIDDVTIAEGNSGTITADFTVTLDAASGKTITVEYSTSDNTATDTDGDYDAITTTILTFNPGETSKTISVTINGDSKDEDDESFFVDLSNPTNATITDSQGEGTITNDDSVPAISIDDVTVTEGNSSTVNANFTVTLDAASGKTITVDYSTSDNTATTADSDYNAIATTTLTFNPGETSKTVSVTVSGDSKDEDDESFFVDLSNPTNATITDSQGEGTITNDDSAPGISIDDVTVTEGNSGTITADFTISLDAASGKTITVDYSTSDNTATTADSDYDAIATTTLTFNPGETSKSFSVTVNGDLNVENDESFFVDLTNAVNASISDNQGIGTISNDESGPQITIGDATVTEGNTGSVSAIFTVSLDASSSSTITVDYTTSDNTASSANGDYDQVSTTTLTFNPGETSHSIEVFVNGDLLDEEDESFFIDLSTATNATIADNQAEGTITDDDDAPSISINDVSVTEGNSGTSTATFTISLDFESGKSVSVDYATSDNTATTADADYDQIGTTTLTFAAGETSKTIDVTINGDETEESDESFLVDLTNAVNASIADNQGEATIEDDDAPALPELTISDVSVTEGSEVVTINVNLSTVSTDDITVDYVSVTNTAEDKDFVSGSGSLTILAGETSASFDVSINDDDTVEIDESFFINLSNVVNATIIDSQAEITIENDDSTELSISDSSIEESDESSNMASFVVTLSNPSDFTVEVDVQSVEGSANSGTDYITFNSQTITFEPGEISKNIDIEVNGDLVVESDETFTIELSNPVNATIANNSATGTIEDDDIASIGIVADIDGEEGASNGQFTIFSDRIFEEDVTIEYELSGTSVVGEDFEDFGSSVILPKNAITVSIPITILEDNIVEETETIVITLLSTNNSKANIGSSSADELAIIDNDSNPIITAASFSIAENTSNGTSVGTLTASDDSGTSFSGWEIIGGNSDQDSDNELPFSINASTGEILVNDSDDLDRESISEFDLEVIVSDGDNESSSAVISISISDVNDVNPIITAGQSFTIAENQASASSLGFLQATDGDITETTFTDWEIISGNDLNIFSLSGSTGELFISSNVNLDFENNTSHTLEISVQDGENTSAIETVLITVTNVNDNNPISIGESYTLNEDEDLTISSPGVLENDLDLDGDNVGAVLVTNVENGTLNLNADGSFYYLPNPDFYGVDSFVYTANDGENNSEETTVEITVNPINDSPTITSIADITASENQVVGPINFTLSDVDHAANELTIEVSADNNNVFTSENIALSGDGFDKTLTLTPTDFASGATIFTIDVTDGDFEISESFTVTVTNDITAPTDIILDVTEIDEDVAVGFVVGTIQTEDTDLNDEHVYTLVEGTGDDNNSMFEIDGNILQVAQPLDFEENEFVSIRIRTTDLSGLTFEKVFEFDIIPNPELELDIPTTFTPNGDMINDTWDIDNILIHQDAKVTVFSTDGARVFESIGYEVPWDGTYQGNELPVGTYYYIIELSGSNLRQYKGFVMILK